MKRKLLLSVLCVSIVATMLVPNCIVPSSVRAAGERRMAVYNGEQITVTVEGDYVILPDDEKIALESFTGTFIEEEAPAEVPTVPEKPAVPEEPAVPEISEEPTAPEEAVTPEEPSASEESTIPGEPTVSEEPEEPGEPAVPEEPTIPGEPAVPEEPTVPGEPTVSEKPTIPGEPAVPEEPTIPGEPTVPEEPTVSEQPMLPGEPVVLTQPKGVKDLLHVTQPAVTAGTDFYIEELEEKYQIRFEDDFKEAVSELEEDSLSFTNWQDVLAVYLLNEKRAGAQKFILNEEDKEGFLNILGQMNVRTIEDGQEVVISQSIEEYEAAHPELTDEEREFLQKYTSSNCRLLCAAATGIKGFIIGSLGDGVSEERAQVVTAAYSLLGKVPYFWGGKSSVIGWDPRWGSEAMVTAAGSRSFGTIRSYGLDCSGFVTWAFINGYEDTDAAAQIGHGTRSQWGRSVEVSEEEALPGDLVFLRVPSEAGINHVGIVVGKNDDGKLVVIHCNSGDNGIVIESAYRAGFRYIRRPEMF